MTKLSIIVPTFNEEQNIKKILDEINIFFLDNNINGEIILVDDGSTDNTVSIAQALAKTILNLKIIIQPVNQGKGAAIKKGVETALGKKIVFTDCDLSYSLDHILTALKIDTQVVVGSRLTDESRYVLNHKMFRALYIRHLTSRVFNIYVRLMLGLKSKDTQCGFKFFDTTVAKKIFSKITRKGFSFDTELLFLVKKYHYTLTEIPVTVVYNNTTSVRLFKDSLLMFKDVVTILFRDLRGKYNE